MGLVDNVAIAAAERVERGGGTRAGLFAWKKLAETASAPETRGRAIVNAWRCAGALRDVDAIHQLAVQWDTVDAGDFDAELVVLCKNLSKNGMLVPATAIAHAETRRRGSALAFYLYARCLDVAGDRRAAAAFAQAIAQAEKTGDGDIARSARVRRAEWLSREPETLPEAVEEAKRVEARDALPAERLVVATVLLRAPSRFARAAALGICDELVAKDSPLALPETRALAARALRLAAQHADDLGDALTPMEIDRLLAILSREPIAKEAARARDAVRAHGRIGAAKDDRALAEALDEIGRTFSELAPLHVRAKEIIAGRVVVQADTNEARPTWDTLLDAVAALHDARHAQVAHALRTLAEREEKGKRVPAQTWSIVLVALASDDAEVRAVAGRLTAAMLASRTATPPRGWLGIAHALAGAGMDDLATHARRLAALAKEPGAAEALGVALTRAGWQFARAGERSRAIAQLREAKSLGANRSG
jgi:hypothetical protein